MTDKALELYMDIMWHIPRKGLYCGKGGDTGEYCPYFDSCRCNLFQEWTEGKWVGTNREKNKRTKKCLKIFGREKENGEVLYS